MLMKQYDAAKLDEAKEAAIIQVVEPGIEPDRRSTPKRVLVVLLCTFVGVFAGCLLALLQWWKSIVQSDPGAAKQIQELRCALMRRNDLKPEELIRE